MSASQHAAPDAGLDRLVAALVSSGGTASQIVMHMEHARRSSATCAQRSTVDTFAALICELAERRRRPR